MRINTSLLLKLTPVFIILASCLLISCTAIKPEAVLKQHAVVLPSQPANNSTGWRTVRFHLPWQRDIEPDWSIGTQIAGEVIAPVLKQFRSKIPVWRFHRRATNDTTGHTFSFMLYSSAQTAEKVYAHISSHPTTQQLQRAGHITRQALDPLEQNPKPDIKDTSDPDWPVAIQKSWPGFMMGASQMWLDLIIQLKADQPNSADQRQIYQTIHQQITKLWEQHGQHAWLHQLNALYSYSPIAVHF
jgi:hypothetical protein